MSGALGVCLARGLADGSMNVVCLLHFSGFSLSGDAMVVFTVVWRNWCYLLCLGIPKQAMRSCMSWRAAGLNEGE